MLVLPKVPSGALDLHTRNRLDDAKLTEMETRAEWLFILNSGMEAIVRENL